LRYACVSSLWIGLSRAGSADSPERRENAADNFSCQNNFGAQCSKRCRKQHDSAALQHSAGARWTADWLFTSESK
jgi:hypothetical protein